MFNSVLKKQISKWFSRVFLRAPNYALVTLILANCVLLGANVFKHAAVQRNHNIKHSYLDDDYPLQLPLRVENSAQMTIQESLRYKIAEPESYAIWHTLEKFQPGKGFVHLGPYHNRFISSAQHQLHCLLQMQQALSKPRRSSRPLLHFEHCLHYLRQTFLCSADGYLEDGDFMMRNFSVDRVEDTHECRDWQLLFDFTNENFDDWKAFNGLK